MVDPRLYATDTFVVLEPQRSEQFLSSEQLRAKLCELLAIQQNTLPPDLIRFETLEAQADYLLETACEFKPEAGGFLQWYAVRLEK